MNKKNSNKEKKKNSSLAGDSARIVYLLIPVFPVILRIQ